METIRRFFKAPKQSFFLFGPRGTGKSTWVQILYPDALRIDLLEPDTFRNFSAHPERLQELLLGNPEKRRIVIDEVQKVPELLSLVHLFLEKKAEYQFILTGSSARKLKRSGADLLAGRAFFYALHPFMATELGKQFHFLKALEYGMLPLVLTSQKPAEVLKAYATWYLKEEVQAEGLVRHIGQFSRFLEVISFSHASLLNVSNIARECEVERKVVEAYISLLEDLLLSFRLFPFTKRAKRASIQHPKFYLFDTGVYRSLRPLGTLDRPTEIEGTALEGLLAQHLRAWIDYGGGSEKLYFWRTRSGTEVDFVIYGPSGLYAIEVKNKKNIHSTDLHPLRTFQEEYPESKCWFLYRGKERLKKENILCMPCEEFLLNLKPGKALPSSSEATA